MKQTCLLQFYKFQEAQSKKQTKIFGGPHIKLFKNGIMIKCDCHMYCIFLVVSKEKINSL